MSIQFTKKTNVTDMNQQRYLNYKFMVLKRHIDNMIVGFTPTSTRDSGVTAQQKNKL